MSSYSPFLSSTRRRRRRPSAPVLAVCVVTGLLSIGLVAPAFGGPSALSIAKKAFKLARKAGKPVGSKRIGNGAVTGIKIAPGAVGNSNLADGSVTNAKIGNGSVGSAKIANGSVTVEDLAGTDITGTLDIGSLPGNSCALGQLSIPGAQVGQVPLIAFVGNVALPTDVMVTAIKVVATDSVRVKACNASTLASSAASGIGIRVITLN